KARKDAEAMAEHEKAAEQTPAAEDTQVADEPKKQTVAGAAARIKSEYDSAQSEPAPEAAEAAETIEGEVVYEVEAAQPQNTVNSDESHAATEADIVDADVVESDTHDPKADDTEEQQAAFARTVTAELNDGDLDALANDLDDDDDILLEDEPRKETTKAAVDAEVSAAESTVFTAPAAYALADDAYDMDETYVSAVDMMYPGAVDPEDIASDHVDLEGTSADEDINADALDDTDEASATDGAETPVDAYEGAEELTEYVAHDEDLEEELVDSSSDTELSEEELEFAQSRVGRGGWDPQADAANKATRYQRRQRTLMGLAAVVVLTVALGIIFGGWLWWTAALAGGLTIVYLVALRTQVRQEQQLRARRISQLRRARLGVRNAQDEELAIPRYLRRPGAVIVEIDDSSPDWDH